MLIWFSKFLGTSESYALDVAASTGMNKALISRAKYYLERLKDKNEIEPLPDHKEKQVALSDLTNLRMPELDIDTESEWSILRC